MFEKYWKPYFDTATNHAGNVLEKVLQNPMVLQSISNVLNTVFRSKMVLDKAIHLAYKGFGLPTYRDQKKILYYVTKLEGQLEDIQDQLQRLEEWRREWRELQLLREQFQALQVQVETLQQRQSLQQTRASTSSDDLGSLTSLESTVAPAEVTSLESTVAPAEVTSLESTVAPAEVTKTAESKQTKRKKGKP